MIVGMAYVSPRRVMQAASPFLRWQVWATTLLCVLAASSTLTARTESPSSQLAEWWPFVLSFAGIFINAGMVWQQLNETKRRLEMLENAVPLTYVRHDVILEKFNTLRSEIAAVRELLEDK